MTILMAGCPLCGSNYMLLNTETRKGECTACRGTHDFTEKEVSDAETRRDRLSEEYIPRLERAFKDRDAEKMHRLATEVAEQGISSWYAWFCIGWSDLQQCDTASACDDFDLAANFIDEESFDEFYSLTMDAVLESIEATARTGDVWMTEDVSLSGFTGTMYDRFDSLSDVDFMTDLVLRIGTLADSLESALTGGSLIREIMSIVLDYVTGNMYVPDQQQITNYAMSSVEAIDARMQGMAQDGTMSPNMVKVWGKGFSEFLQMMLDGQSALIAEYPEDQLLQLCEYWEYNDCSDVFTFLYSALDYHTGYIVSGKRNKGIMKKRDKAFAGYQDTFSRPLREGLQVTREDEEEDFDRICPGCGKPLYADETGLMKCECGFRSRIVTDAIYDLPESVPELVDMVEKALPDRDPMALNNLGERILEFDRENWYGFFALAQSCLLDMELNEGIAMLTEACQRLDYRKKDEFADMVVEEIPKAVIGVSDDPGVFPIFVIQLYDAISRSPACDCDIPRRLIRRLSQEDAADPNRGACIILIMLPTMSYEVRSNADIRYQRDMMADFSGLCRKILDDIESHKDAGVGVKRDLVVLASMLRDLTAYFVTRADARISSMTEEEIGAIAAQWDGSERYNEISMDLMDCFYTEPDISYNPKSKAMLKSKHGIDRYVENYLAGPGSR